MDAIQIVSLVLSLIGGATVAFRIIAPLTEAKWDNKVLKALETILSMVALNRDTGKIEVKVK